MKLLIVDDNKVLLEALADTIKILSPEYLGCQVKVHSQPFADKVLQDVYVNEPDYIILDIIMGKTDGVALAKEILENNSKSKIIMMTAFSEKRNVDEILKMGVLKVFNKPVSAEDILSFIAKGISGNLKETIMANALLKNKNAPWSDLGALVDYIIKNKLLKDIGLEGFSMLLHIYRQNLIEPDGYAYFQNSEINEFLNLHPKYEESKLKRYRQKLKGLGLLEHTSAKKKPGRYKVIVPEV